MRATTDLFAARLAAPVTSLALCWQIIRRDGVAIGLSTHDEPITIDGMIYNTMPGLVPSAITLGQAGSAHAMEIFATLGTETLREDDLVAGLFDAASARAFFVDWEAPEAGIMVLASGTIGTIECRDGTFVAELRTALDDFDRLVVETYSPTCRASLGDKRCRVDLSARTRVVSVSRVDGATVMTRDLISSDGRYRYGRARVISGAAAGIERPIDDSSGDAIVLRSEVPGLVSGARIELREGCDHRFSTCRDRFGNMVNFRGEPHVPGEDAVTRYASL